MVKIFYLTILKTNKQKQTKKGRKYESCKFNEFIYLIILYDSQEGEQSAGRVNYNYIFHLQTLICKNTIFQTLFNILRTLIFTISVVEWCRSAFSLGVIIMARSICWYISLKYFLLSSSIFYPLYKPKIMICLLQHYFNGFTFDFSSRLYPKH